MTFPWTLVWLVVWLIAGTPTVAFEAPDAWAVSLVVCALLDLLPMVRR